MKTITKQELRNYIDMRLEIKELKEEIEQLRSVAIAPKIPQLSATGGSGSHGVSDKIGEVVARIESVEKLYERKINALCEMTEHIETEIEHLEPKERILIRLHYIQGATWEQITQKINLSWAQIHRLHRVSLIKLAK